MTGEYWGLETIIDLHGCAAYIIRDRLAIGMFAKEVCDKLKMRPYGPPEIVHFGSDDAAGYTLVQKIETSLVSGHFAEASNRAFINIFSCKPYNAVELGRFVSGFFKAEHYNMKILRRK